MMALKIHPEGSKGLYKDNLSRVAGVEVEIRKEKKGDEGNLVAGVTVEERKRKYCFKIQGRTRFEDNYSKPLPGNGARNACWYFLTLTEKSTSTRKYRCSISPGSIQGIVFSTRNGGVTVIELVHP